MLVKHFISFSVLLFLVLSIPAQERYVVLVSMDGFRWDYPTMYHTPNLDKIAKRGVKAHSLIPSFPSVTFPNHYTIATGLYPDHHGLVHNNFYDDSLKLSYSISNRKVVEDPRFYGGEPIWNTAGRQGLKTASYFWVGSETMVNGKQPDYWKRYDQKVDNGSRIDTVAKWLSLPENARPRLVLLYFSEPDHTGHLYGPHSPETNKTVVYMDSLMGVLYSKLMTTPVNKSIDLIIVSDHGMSAVSEEKNIVLDQFVPKTWCRQIEGYNPFYMIQPEAGYDDSVYNALGKVAHLKVWKKNEIPAHLNYGSNSRIFPVVVLADSSYSLTWSFKRIEKGGAHGYDIRNTDMHGIFYAVGPDFKKDMQFPSFQNIHIYDLIAGLLKITPAPNDGKPEATFNMLKKRN